MSQQSESTHLLAETSLKENTNSVLAKATKGVKEKKPSQEAAGVKQRELRQIELKLKKWGEELKGREVKVDELENDRMRLEEYLCKPEARNVELEATVRALQRRISILEGPGTLRIPGPHETLQDQNCQHQTVPTVTMKPDAAKENDEFLHGLHGLQQQVTKFILNKVTQQFHQLEKQDRQSNYFVPQEALHSPLQFISERSQTQQDSHMTRNAQSTCIYGDWKSRKETPQKLTQLSSRSHPRHLVGKRTAQKDITIDTTSDSQVNSNFPNRWSPASLTLNNYFYLFLYLYITCISINNNAPHLKSPKDQNRLRRHQLESLYIAVG